MTERVNFFEQPHAEFWMLTEAEDAQNIQLTLAFPAVFCLFRLLPSVTLGARRGL